MAISSTSESTDELTAGMSSGSSKSWNWHPDIPIRYSPLFSWPPKPMGTLRWIAGAWLPITELGLYLLLAIAVWHWFTPSFETMATVEAGWVAAIWLRNIVLMTAIATGLHLWLHSWERQGAQYRFMKRKPTGKAKTFFGGRQLVDNVFWTLASGVTVWTFYEVILWSAYAHGVAPMIGFAQHPVWFVLLFLLVAIWTSFHFYWVHRFLHWAPMYDRFHSVHHRNVTLGPWSGLSMHPVEHLLYLSSFFIHLVVPSHPIHMLFHVYWLTLATATSHSGYQSLLLGKSSRTTIATFFHQVHHRYFNCNYGNLEIPMDHWFGSFNDGSSASTRRLFQAHQESQNKSGE